MPLSEEELRLLEQMERALVAEDPKFASALRGTAIRRHARRRALVAGGVFVLGVVVLMTGAVLAETIIAVVGFVVMLGSAVVALTAWRGHTSAPEQGAPQPGHPEAAPGLSVIQGGNPKKRTARQRPAKQSMMQRFEERWQRRRGNSGF